MLKWHIRRVAKESQVWKCKPSTTDVWPVADTEGFCWLRTQMKGRATVLCTGAVFLVGSRALHYSESWELESVPLACRVTAPAQTVPKSCEYFKGNLDHCSRKNERHELFEMPVSFHCKYSWISWSNTWTELRFESLFAHRHRPSWLTCYSHISPLYSLRKRRALSQVVAGSCHILPNLSFT